MPCGTSVKVQQSVEPQVDVELLNVRHVKYFLKRNPAVLQDYVLNNVSQETILRAIRKKKAKASNTENNILGQIDKDGNHAYIGNILKAKTNSDLHKAIFQMCRELAKTFKADVFHMYVLGSEGLCMYWARGHVELLKYVPTVPAFAALHKLAVTISATRLKHDPRFNKLTDRIKNQNLCHTMAVPILSDCGVIAIIEFSRPQDWESFTLHDLKLLSGILTWIAAYIQMCIDGKNFERNSKIHLLLKERLPTLFDDITKTETIVRHAESITKEFIPCEQSFLHMTDYAAVVETTPMDSMCPVEYALRKEKIVNFQAETSDVHCTPEVASMLCVPIVGKEGPHGVMQLVNRKEESRFTEEDEDSFSLLSVYLDSAFRYCKKYKKQIELLDQLKTIHDSLKKYNNHIIEERRRQKEIPHLPECYLQQNDIVSNFANKDNGQLVTENKTDIDRQHSEAVCLNQSNEPTKFGPENSNDIGP